MEWMEAFVDKFWSYSDHAITIFKFLGTMALSAAFIVLVCWLFFATCALLYTSARDKIKKMGKSPYCQKYGKKVIEVPNGKMYRECLCLKCSECPYLEMPTTDKKDHGGHEI